MLTLAVIQVKIIALAVGADHFSIPAGGQALKSGGRVEYHP